MTQSPSTAIPLTSLTDKQLLAMRRGIEKESLRCLPNGALALTPHPVALGAALTHATVTTDFSESQLELITGAHSSVEATLQQLTEIHQGVYHALKDELMWVSSMPCGLPGDESIPLGRYGTSNVGRAKSVYRMGLGHRYGRRMQTISGIHYNWSIPGLSNQDYFGLIRNFRRHSFVLLYLFGAAPAVCSSFLAGRPHNLDPFQANNPNGTLFKPYATSLRMGRLGYQSAAQAQLKVSYNSLEEYASALRAAMTTPYPAYEAIGVKNPGGEYNQLSTSLLQLENEFYGMIRPKRTTRSGERPVPALLDRGVEYVEVRCMDLDPFETVGINANTMRFIDMLLLHCLTTDSPLDTPEAIVDMGENVDKVTSRGREPGLQLTRLGKPILLTEWLIEILKQMRPIAARLDTQFGEQHYGNALDLAFEGLADPSSLPSARVIEAMQQSESKSYVAFIRQQSALAMDQLKALPWSKEQADNFAEIADTSLDDQKAIELADDMSFDDYVEKLLDL